METYGAVLEFHNWTKMVKRTISSKWLCMIEDDWELQRDFEDILGNLHRCYKPRANGVWAANPKWTEIFSWTSCPLNAVHAIVLLKGPNVGKPDKKSDFECTGDGGGVRHKNTNNGWQEISDIPTVWNMFKISLLVNDLPNKERILEVMKPYYTNGFNPKPLSKKGILILNVALTCGHNDANGHSAFYGNGEVRFWQTFILNLVKKIPGNNIPLFQWYITKEIESTLANLERDGKIVLSKPNTLRFDQGYPKHICGFGNYKLLEYAGELKAPEYARHKVILQEIFKTLVFEADVMTWPAPERGIIRKWIEEQDDLSSKKIWGGPKMAKPLE